MTSLAAQLNALALQTGDGSSRVKKGKSSVLYDPLEAAEYDMQTIYEVGMSGLEQLAQVDPRFEGYTRTLFAPSSVSQPDRDQMTPDLVARSDALVASFLRLLSDHLLLPAAFRALEYLVRRYRVHRFLTPELLLCALPYHAANEFVKIAALCKVEGTPFEFLAKSKETGVALPRELLVRRCLNDFALLKALADHAQTLGGAGGPRPCPAAFVSFFAILACEVLLTASAPEGVNKGITEEITAALLPALVSGMHREAAEELAAAALMATGVLARRAALSASACDDLLELVCRCPHLALNTQVIIAANLLTACKAEYDLAAPLEAPASAARVLLRRPGITALVLALEEQGTRLSYLVPALARHLAPRALQPEGEPARAALADLLRCAALNAPAAEAIALALLTGGAAGQAPTARGLLSALEARQPAAVDAAINAALRAASDATRDQLVGFLQQSFEGTARVPVAEAGTTLLGAADHPAASLRAAALEKIAPLYSAPATAPETRDAILSAFTRRLRDDEPAVVAAALEHGAAVLVAGLGAERTAREARACLDKASEQLLGARPSADGAAAVARRAVKLLGSLALEHPSVAPLAQAALLAHCLAPPGAGLKKVAHAALAALGKLDAACFGGLAAAAEAAEAEAEKAQQSTPAPKFADKKGKKGKDAAPEPAPPASKKDRARKVDEAISQAVLGGLLANISAGGDAVTAKLAAIAAHAPPRARHLVLLALLAALKETKAAKVAASAAAAVLATLETTWAALIASGSEELPVLTPAGAPDPEHLAALAQAATFPAALHAVSRQALLAALEALPKSTARALALTRALAALGAPSVDPLVAAVAGRGEVPAPALLALVFVPADHPAPERVRALSAVAMRAAASEHAGDDVGSAIVALLSAAADTLESSVRSAAAAALAAVHAALVAGRCVIAGRRVSQAAVTAFLAAILSERPAWENDPSHLIAAVKAFLRDASEGGDRAKGKKAPAASSALLDFVLDALDRPSDSTYGAATCQLAIECAAGIAPPATLLGRCLPLLEAAFAPREGSAALFPAVKRALVAMTPGAVEALPQDARTALAGLILRGLGLGIHPPTRLALLSALTPALWALTAAGDRCALLKALGENASAEEHDEVRLTARSVLDPLEVTAADVAPLLEQAVSAGVPKTAAAKKARKTQEGPSVSLVAANLPTAEHALELLSWKDVQGEKDLVAPCSALIDALLNGLSAARAEAAENGQDRPAGSVFHGVHYGYLLQLALATMDAVAKRLDAPTVLRAFAFPLVLRAAREAPDAAARNAAMGLMCSIALAAPDTALEHVLEVLTVTGEAVAVHEDAYSLEVAVRLLEAVVPAWTRGGRDQGALMDKITAALPQVPAHRRVPFLRAVLVPAGSDAAVAAQLLFKLLQGGAKAPDSGLADVASQLAASLLAPLRMSAYASLLASASADTIPLVAAFVATELPRLRVDLRSAAAKSPEALHASQGALQAIMTAVVAQTLSLGAALSKSPSSAKAKALTGALEQLAAILTVLETLMASEGFLDSLLRLLDGAALATRRRALRMLATRVHTLGQDVMSLAEEALLTAGDRAAREARIAAAALRACPLLRPILDGTDKETAEEGSGATRQAALMALDAITRKFGPSDPSAVLACVPSVLVCLADARSGVRSSTFVCLASMVVALGARALPIVPQAVPGILGGAAKATDAAVQGGEGAHAAALELASALMATLSLVEGLGAFLSPQLPAILRLVLDPRVQSLKAAECGAIADKVRKQLPASVPARLLLPALASFVETSMEAGEASTVALLDIVTATAQALDAKTAPAHLETVFGTLLRALDVRALKPAGIQSVPRVEKAAVAALISLVMKLSESRFKPLFLRLLEWASAPVEADKRTARNAAFFHVCVALTARLRSVFVPYFKYLMDLALVHLGGEGEGAPAKGPAKKKRKQAAGAAEEDETSADDRWELRLQVVRSLHECFLYDTVGFLDAAKFERVLPSLAAQLNDLPPPEVLARMAAEEDAFQPDRPSHMDAYGAAAVATLVQMAVTAGSDALWKPLNHQVLMATRQGIARTKLLALEAVSGMAERLREEYLVLLPETLPFLSELLEDPEVAVEMRAQALVAQLEKLSGESLDDYLK